MDIRERVAMELQIRILNLGQARKRLRDEEREASREKRPLPNHLRDRLNGVIKDCKASIVACEAALEAVGKFPPVYAR